MQQPANRESGGVESPFTIFTWYIARSLRIRQDHAFLSLAAALALSEPCASVSPEKRCLQMEQRVNLKFLWKFGENVA